jgi:heterodisulfide reductase subunit A
MIGAVAIAGGGVAGIQSALDLANSGFKVYMIEPYPTIGGHMAKLDKTFPTLDCAQCTLAPRLVEVGRHPNIQLLTYSEIIAIEGTAGNFTLKVKRKPRYINEEKCTGCGECVAKCPSKVEDEFNEGTGMRKAVYLPFPQAIPRVMTIDAEHCLYLQKGKCGVCKKVCPFDAVDYEQEERVEEINVGSIILSAGFEPFDPSGLEQYRIDHPDVLTSLQFERLLSASGPTEGKIVKKNGEEPKKIAFIQCVGSRNPEIGRKNCSAVCCMYATKEAMVAKEHNPELDITIFNIDIRAFGKGFEEFYQKAKNEHGIRYVRSRPPAVYEDPKTGRISVRYEKEDGSGIEREDFDLIVLSIGLSPSSSAQKLAELAGVELDEHGNIASDTLSPLQTNVPGIYACGTVMGPRDIPDTVADGSGTASKASSLLQAVRGTLITRKTYPPEKPADQIRIGVVVCRCGINIGSVVDVPSVVEYAKTLPGVVYAREETYACSVDSQEGIKQMIKEHDLTRVVVAACTPRTHEPLFQETCKDAGLNPYLFEIANIREHCSWVHQKEKEKATEKAKDILRMTVKKASMNVPLQTQDIPFNKSALVVGGGVSGMTAALDIAEKGFPVYLVEREAELGGFVRNLTALADGRNAREVLDGLIQQVESNPNITVLKGSEIIDAEGSVGNFQATIRQGSEEQTIEFGVAILATGAIELTPTGYFSYGERDNVITQSQLEKKLDEDFKAKSVVMIQCAGARVEERPYCSRNCCASAVKNAIRIKEMSPETDVFIIYRDIRTYGVLENLYTRARELGVIFARYTEDKPPVVGDDVVTVYDHLIGRTLIISSDLVVLSAPLVKPEGVEKLAELFKVPLDSNGFFMEAHIKLKPVEFATDGVFVCGTAQAPKLINESVSQASAAASRACTILSKDALETSGVIAQVDENVCIGCGWCLLCPYSATSLKEVTVQTEEVTYTGKKSQVNPAACKGCGACAAECPTGAMKISHFTREQIQAMMDALTREEVAA